MQDFLAMGGYAFYVWSAYGLTAIVLIGLLLQSLLWHRRLKRRQHQRDFS